MRFPWWWMAHGGDDRVEELRELGRTLATWAAGPRCFLILYQCILRMQGLYTKREMLPRVYDKAAPGFCPGPRVVHAYRFSST
jgi:hypothetical protein